MKIKLINHSTNPMPCYETEGAAGMDVQANLCEPLTLQSLERALVPTGLFMEIPRGFEAQIRPRSGLALKHGLTIPNAPGTIDSDYRGEVRVIVFNCSKEPFTIHHGDRIAQMVIARHEKVEWQKANELADSFRGEGGFGHTGK